jgi:hypothetical protein
MEHIPAGWKKGASNTDSDSLFKIYKIDGIQTAFVCLERVKQAILASDLRACTFVTLSNDALTITINDLGEKKPLGEIIAFAEDLDSLLVAPENVRLTKGLAA